MKLLRARFSNFRLLRNIELDFRLLAGDKKLIVLRAENESGKTTILNGLQWGLFGDDAIPRAIVEPTVCIQSIGIALRVTEYQ